MLQFVVNGILAGSIYALIAMGFAVIYKTVRFFHLAHGVVYTVGAYLAYTLIIQSGINPIISFFFASALAGLVGVAVDRLVYRPLRRQEATNLAFLIASFGVFIFIQNLLQLIYGAQILTIRRGPVKEGHHILGAVITDVQILIMAVSILLMVLLWIFIQRTKLGKAMRAVADDPVAASVVGIYPERIILGIIAAIIGGIGSIPGAVAGGFFLGIAENLGIWKIQAGWKDGIAFAILIIFLLIRPGGIWGVLIDKERI
jgi:branched-chain amino acid transport system permease protein